MFFTRLFSSFSSSPQIPMLIDLSRAPDDVIREIFKNLPAKDVVKCSMVCKQWMSVVDSHSFWIEKCIYDDYLSDPKLIKQIHKIPINILKVFVVKRAFNRNLLDDDYSLEKPKLDQRWSDVKQQTRRGYPRYNIEKFKVQSPPNFLSINDRAFDRDECPEPFVSCLVSSHTAARRMIYVNLEEYGLTPEVLNLLKPTIVVTEYYTNRRDCSCMYSLRSILLDSDEEVHSQNPNDLEGWQTTDVRIDQWDDEYWRKAEHVWKEYDEDNSVVFVSTMGKDGQFWAGAYGAKIAGTSIVVKLEFNSQQFK